MPKQLLWYDSAIYLQQKLEVWEQDGHGQTMMLEFLKTVRFSVDKNTKY
jgi:hypothetical protein